jgi:leucyl-tRNA synthetase
MGPPELDCQWQDDGVEGIRRFTSRFINYLEQSSTKLADGQTEDIKVTKSIHKLIKEIQERLALFKPNTAIAAFMEWTNEAMKEKMQLSSDSLQKVLTLFSIFAPHAACELLEQILSLKLDQCSWPTYEQAMVQETEAHYSVMVNGKLRGTLTVAKGTEKDMVIGQAQILITKWLEQKTIVKVIFIQDRTINFVVKD